MEEGEKARTTIRISFFLANERESVHSSLRYFVASRARAAVIFNSICQAALRWLEADVSILP